MRSSSVYLHLDVIFYLKSLDMFAGRHVRYASVCAFRWSCKLLSRTQKRCVFVQVLSGDTVIVRGPPRGGPPPERTIGLSNVTAPRLARRPGIADESKESKDEVQSIFVPSVYTCPVDYCISVSKCPVILYSLITKGCCRSIFFILTSCQTSMKS